MEHWVDTLAHQTAHAIEGIAILIIAYGVIEALVGIIGIIVRRGKDAEKRRIWLGLAQWLVAGLTFQLAGDIVITVVAPTWFDIAEVGAIAAIRTFLSYFLDRDVEKVRERMKAHAEPQGVHVD